MQKLLLIDGNSIFNRAFYGLGSTGDLLKTSSGLYTNAIFGFLNIYFKNLNEEQPTHVCVAFDRKGKTFLHEQYDLYKANRTGMPDEMAVQFPVLKDVLSAMNVCIIEKDGYEADDIIGSICKKFGKQGYKTVILTGDRDAYQLIDPNVSVKLPVIRKGVSGTEFIDLESFTEKYGLKPEQMIDVKALMGDKSDNIPGVLGIGEKTALKLIGEYGSLDEVYRHIEEIKPPSVKQKLTEHKDEAYLSYELAKIDTETDHGFTLDDATLKDYDRKRLFKLFKDLEFNSLIQRLGLQETAESKEEDAFSCPVSIIASVKELCSLLDSLTELNILVKTDAKDHPFVKITDFCIHTNQGSYYVDPRRLADSDCETDDAIYDKVVCLLREKISSGCPLLGYDLKQLYLALSWFEIIEEQQAFDLLIAAYLLDPSSKDYSIKTLYGKYTGSEIGKTDCGDDILLQKAGALAQEAYAMTLLKDKLFEELFNNNQYDLFKNVEIPLITVLAFMEYTGFYLDKEALTEYGIDLEKRIEKLMLSIYTIAGHEFNINSPKQLGQVLFEELKLPAVKKTKSGYSTDAGVLEKLRYRHEIIEHILEYRQLVKLKSTYVDAMLSLVNPKTQRIHTVFKQDVTVTGRLSSTEPNLQNIPVRTEEGRNIRKAFTAYGDKVLVDADYSQIELRVLSHIADDKAMQEAFANDMDIHRITAAKVFGVEPEEVTYEQRSRAKAVNFGIVYGIGEFSLSEDLKVSIKEAKKYIDDYLEHYNGVASYMKEVVASAYEKGYVETILHRRRYIDELNSSNKQIRMFGERVAMNAPIQGSAADIIKVAMVKVYKKLKELGLKSKLILQVHDELIIEAEPEEAEQVAVLLKECMESAVKLKTKLSVDVNIGKSWFDTK
jgi:DNA polymerase-1